MSLQRAPRFQDYVLSRVLGEGGMGVVYQATQKLTGLPVAIKVMSRYFEDEEMKARFFRENQILSSVNHRNIVRCYALVRSVEGLPCLVMEYLDGVDLRAFEGRPYPELLPLMIQVLLGMEYLRQQQIVHRDLSSNNITVILENGSRLAKILDFGIAKILDSRPGDGESLTQTGTFMGKYPFAAPELFKAMDAGWRCDMYSLGVVFYRLLCRRYPVQVDQKNNYYQWVLAHDRPNEITFNFPPGALPLPADLQETLVSMLAKDAESRPGSYIEVIRALDIVQQRARLDGLMPDAATFGFLPPRPADGTGSRPSAADGPAPQPAPVVLSPIFSPARQAGRLSVQESEEAPTNLIEDKTDTFQDLVGRLKPVTPLPAPKQTPEYQDFTVADEPPPPVKVKDRTPVSPIPAKKKARVRTAIDTGVVYGPSGASPVQREPVYRQTPSEQLELPPSKGPNWLLIVGFLIVTLLVFAGLSYLLYVAFRPSQDTVHPGGPDSSFLCQVLDDRESLLNGAQLE